MLRLNLQPATSNLVNSAIPAAAGKGTRMGLGRAQSFCSQKASKAVMFQP